MRTSRLVPQIMPWILAGVLSGMAILTRSTGVVLIGVVGLVLLIRLYNDLVRGKTLYASCRYVVTSGLIWLVTTITTIFALLPALWVAPGDTLEQLWAWSSNAATEGHENPTFFNGIHRQNPGWEVYPTVLIWRTSPAEWIGVALFAITGLFAWRYRSKWAPISPLIPVAIVFAVVYIGAMTLGAKKFDRYILPVFPIVALLAARGISLSYAWLSRTGSAILLWSGRALIIAIVLVQVLAWNSTRPYRLDYYSPILGGAEHAQHVLQMGWGQGGDQVVDYLMSQTESGPITVQTSAVPSAFTYFLTTDAPVQFESFGLGTPAGWYETDFYVAGIQQTQRDLAPWFNLFADADPVHSVLIGGVSYFDVYAVASQPLPAQLRNPTACNYRFGDEATLMQIIDRGSAIDLYFLAGDAGIEQPLTVDVTVSSPDGTVHREQATLPVTQPGRMAKVTVPIGIDNLQDALMALSVSDGNAPLPVTSDWLDAPQDSTETQSECYYMPVPET